MDLSGKVVAITGGANGIGKCAAQYLLREGAKVAICDSDCPAGEAAVGEFLAEFGSDSALFCHMDVTCPSSFHKAVQYVKAKWGQLDVLINNAGILKESQWERMIDVNLKGMIRGCYLAMEMMGKHRGGKGGTILNVCSNLGIFPFQLFPSYSATKGGAVAFTRCISGAAHYERSGVRVIGICPGKVSTKMTSALDIWEDDEDMNDRCLGASHISSLRPEELAEVLVRLLKEGENGAVWFYETGSPPYPVNFIKSQNPEYNLSDE